MIDIHIIRAEPEIVKQDLEKRGMNEKLRDVDELTALDKDSRQLQYDKQKIIHKRNELNLQISKLKKQGKSAAKELKEAKQLPKKLEQMEKKHDFVKKKIIDMLMRIPNILHESVPEGKSPEENQVVEIVGKKPSFKFKPKSHVDLMEELDIVDIERAAKISGSRTYFLKNELVMLDLALQRFALDFLIKKGYTAIYPPFFMNRKSYEGVTDLGDFEDVMYKLENEDLYLIATSEHPMTAMFMNEVLFPEQLPIKLTGTSACFRKEAGSHGKDTKGIFRVHQFHKIEQIVICKPDQSWKYHEEMIANAKELFKALGIHFRIMNMCTADIGTLAAKKYDLETWMPAQNTYREVVSCSNCTDYQARRLGIRYRTKEGNKIVHTLNSTAIATGRAIVAILENFQDEEGNVHIPKVLQPYMNGLEKIEKKK